MYFMHSLRVRNSMPTVYMLCKSDAYFAFPCPFLVWYAEIVVIPQVSPLYFMKYEATCSLYNAQIAAVSDCREFMFGWWSLLPQQQQKKRQGNCTRYFNNRTWAKAETAIPKVHIQWFLLLTALLHFSVFAPYLFAHPYPSSSSLISVVLVLCNFSNFLLRGNVRDWIVVVVRLYFLYPSFTLPAITSTPCGIEPLRVLQKHSLENL